MIKVNLIKYYLYKEEKMIEQMYVDLPQQFNTYHSSVSPIVKYCQNHKNKIPTESEKNKLLTYAKQTEFILMTFHEIIDDLNYDKAKFEQIVYNFDDDYDLLKSFIKNLNPLIKSHKELINVSNNILDNLIKAQNELGIIISKNEYKKI